jgi:MFS family permease
LSAATSHDPYQALRFAGFRRLLAGNIVASLGGQMLALAVGWELYERTNSALALGLVGLVQLLPVVLLSLVTGHLADHHDRKRIVLLAQGVLVAASVGLTALALLHGPLVAVYACLALRGIGNALGRPAASALPAEVVPGEALENSASWQNGFAQVASIAGPALGGLIIALFHVTFIIYALDTLAGLAFIGLLVSLRREYVTARAPALPNERPSLRSLAEGGAFLLRTPIVLSALTLDLFAVLFGGATALLPIFAKDILAVGPSGLGWLQAAPAIGAVGMALYLAHRPPLGRAGPTLLLAVAGFGAVTVLFGLSRSFWLSLVALLMLGCLDGISMIVRDTLVLTRVPDEMRGRVAAIEGVFVNSSNQLGGFESGLTAQLFGPVLSVIGGGIGTIIVVVAIATAWPDLRRLRTLREAAPV